MPAARTLSPTPLQPLAIGSATAENSSHESAVAPLLPLRTSALPTRYATASDTLTPTR
jgi:hypothetical protein